MSQKYLDFMLTTITAFMILSPALQSAGLPANVKSKFPTILGKSKAEVDKLLGEAKSWSNDQTLVCDALVSFTYDVKGSQSIQVIYTKSLEKSLKFVIQFPDQTMTTKDLVTAVGFTLGGPVKFAPMDPKGPWVVSPVKELKKPWVMSVFNSTIDKKGYAANIKFYAELGFGFAVDYEFTESSAVEIVDVSTDFTK